MAKVREKVLAFYKTLCYTFTRTFLKGGYYCESKIISKTDLRKILNTNKDRANEYIENLKNKFFRLFRVYKFKFLLSVLQHRPSQNDWLSFILGVVILQR